MDFGLSQDQRLLDESLRKFLTSEVPLDSVRKLAAGESSDASVWQGLASMGLAGVLIPEAYGGAQLGMLDAVAIAEALGYAACPGPFMSTAVMASYYLEQAGATDPLAAMAAGTYRVGIAFSDAIGTRKGHIVEVDSALSGQSLFALDAEADAYLIGLGDGRVFMIEASEVVRTPLTTVDVTRSVCELTLNDTPACLVSSDPELLKQTLYRGRAIQAADTLGAAQYMLDEAVDYW